jgi:SAM-dependent methyltransferase
VTGLDATAALLDIARERVPAASLVVGDLEDPLPFDPGSFDVITTFNAIQYAADPVTAVKGMSQLVRPGGSISQLVWGPPDQCESGAMFAELGPLLPPRPDEAPGAIAWSEDGQLEHLAALAGLTPIAVTDVANPLIYPDLATAVRTQLSSGPARAAIQHSGLPPPAARSPAPSPAAASRMAPTGRRTCSVTWSPGPKRSKARSVSPMGWLMAQAERSPGRRGGETVLPGPHP